MITYPGVDPDKDEEGGEEEDAKGGEGGQAHHLLPVKGRQGPAREGSDAGWHGHLSLEIQNSLHLDLKDFCQFSFRICKCES